LTPTNTPSPTPRPTNTPTLTPTRVPTATNTSVPTATNTPTSTSVPTSTVTPTTALVAVSGTVYNDGNGNGVQDQGEQGVSGVTVHVSGPQFTSVTTNSSGVYSASNLTQGQYTVVVVAPSGYHTTTASSPVVNLTGPMTVNFGIQQNQISSTPTPTLVTQALPFTINLGVWTLQNGDTIEFDFIHDATGTKYTLTPTVSRTAQTGIYTLTISHQMQQGSYTVYVTAKGHLRKKYALSYPPSNNSLLDLSANPLVSGDVNADNRINALDLGGLVQFYGTSSTNYDLDGNGTVDAQDAALILQNYLKGGD